MRPYTFYLHEVGHEAPSFDFVQCSNPEEARTHARMLLQRYPEYEAVEIFDGRDLRNRIARGEPASLSAG